MKISGRRLLGIVEFNESRRIWKDPRFDLLLNEQRVFFPSLEVSAATGRVEFQPDVPRRGVDPLALDFFFWGRREGGRKQKASGREGDDAVSEEGKGGRFFTFPSPERLVSTRKAA